MGEWYPNSIEFFFAPEEEEQFIDCIVPFPKNINLSKFFSSRRAMGNRPRWMRAVPGRQGKFGIQFVDDQVSNFEGYSRPELKCG